MHENFDKRSWEWIDEHHFVCRERSISQDGERLISREVIVHDEMGVIADQFYAERLYTRESISKLMEKTGFRNVRHHGHAEAHSDRDQDLGMMARRILLTADAPQLPGSQGPRQAAGARRHGADGRPAPARPGQARRHVQPGGPGDGAPAARRALGAAGLQVPLSQQPRHAGAGPGRAQHRPGVQPVRRGLEQRSLQGAARAGPARGAGHRLHRRRAVGAGGLLRQGAGARGRPGARRARAARKLRASGRPGRDPAVGVPGAAEAEPRRQQPGHHQGLRRHQREGPARLSRPAARRLPQARRVGAGISHRCGILGAAHRQSGSGAAGAADPGGRLLQAR